MNRQYFYDKCGFYKLWNSLKQFMEFIAAQKNITHAAFTVWSWVNTSF